MFQRQGEGGKQRRVGFRMQSSNLEASRLEESYSACPGSQNRRKPLGKPGDDVGEMRKRSQLSSEIQKIMTLECAGLGSRVKLGIGNSERGHRTDADQ